MRYHARCGELRHTSESASPQAAAKFAVKTWHAAGARSFANILVVSNQSQSDDIAPNDTLFATYNIMKDLGIAKKAGRKRPTYEPKICDETLDKS